MPCTFECENTCFGAQLMLRTDFKQEDLRVHRGVIGNGDMIMKRSHSFVALDFFLEKLGQF